MPTINRAFSRLLLLTLALVGCSDSSSPSGSEKPGLFESDYPSSSQNGGAKGEADNAGLDSLSGGRNASAPSTVLSGNFTSSDTAARAIVEADIIQLDGNRLYALSRYAGLTVIDATDPAHMTVLGRYRALNGTPFEMYLQNGVVLAMYSGWGQYVKQGDDYAWVQTSKVVALDTNNPATIAPVGTFDVAGDISDSRLVGSVMYVVSYQNGYCWSCEQNKERTAVLALDVRNPRAVQKVDELDFADDTQTYGWKRSIFATDQRIYVAGPEYTNDGVAGSTIQVIDISDPTGHMVAGATVKVAGQISNRWQMDEYQGVLRTISQIPQWWWNGTQTSPFVQTFRVDSAQSLVALGNTELRIPANEQLQTVRFDGARGYAITSQQTDPLFTIDLSDPANPRQVGELVMPGWVYHLEPRGNRVIGLGYDRMSQEGSITVSVFDVTDLAHPKMLDRVNFGGTWASLPEDQDRIQKAFKINDELGLITVPFSGWNDGALNSTCGGYYDYGSYRNGIQLVDLQGDDLTLRGAAPARGQARRALIHNQRLISVGDEAVDAFDFSNRDQPTSVGHLDIARYVSQALPLANQTVARVNQDWYATQSVVIDFGALADVDRTEVSLGTLDLTRILKPTDCGNVGYVDHVFASGNQLQITYQRWGGSSFPSYEGIFIRGVVIADATDPTKPVVISKFEQADAPASSTWNEFYAYDNYVYQGTPVNVVRTDNAIAFLEQRYNHTNNNYTDYDTQLRIFNLTDPAHPTATTLALPKADGYSGLVVDGEDVLISHYERTTNGRRRFYLDRIELSQPSAPSIADKINIPGSLLHFDSVHQRMLSSELKLVTVENVTANECYQRFAYGEFSFPTNGSNWDYDNYRSRCQGYTQTLHMARLVDGGAVLEGSIPLADNERLSASSMGDSRIAAVISRGNLYYGYGLATVDCLGRCGGYGGSTQEPVDLLSIGGFDTGTLSSGRLTVANTNNSWWGWWGSPPVYAFGTRALVQSSDDAVVLDLANPAAPTIARTVPLYATASSVNASGNLVLLSLGMNGIQRVDL